MTRRGGNEWARGFEKRVSIFRKQRRYEENTARRGAAVGRTEQGLRYNVVFRYSGILVVLYSRIPAPILVV
jgi:hypothetical protein